MITAANKRVAHARPRLACLLVALTIVTGLAHAGPEPARGMLLVASPDMRGTWFARSVILLIQHDESGTAGLLINRQTDITPAELLPGVGGLNRLRHKLYIGGPVAGRGITMLVESEAPPDRAQHVFADVYASGNEQLLLEIADRGEAAQRIRLYAGYAGWVPGQLEAEIRRGSWTVMPAAATLVFSTAPGDLWEHLVPAARAIIVRRHDESARL
ncbi:MAG: YqgE/AlgH family protein [Gammaproteobacteria bacterium]